MLVLLGSSRGDGNTAQILDAAFGKDAWRDLRDYAIAPYDYGHDYEAGDGFYSLAEMMGRASDIVVATPVYWYAMSAQVKVFLDRWSDLITVRKDLGRALAGRRLWLIATSADPVFPPGFEVPFDLTARYMGMSYGGGLHVQCADEGAVSAVDSAALSLFAEKIMQGSRVEA